MDVRTSDCEMLTGALNGTPQAGSRDHVIPRQLHTVAPPQEAF